jgi:diacylglycerol kinase (ATP)
MKFEKDERFLSGRMKSFKYALQGAYKLAKTEHSVIAQLSIGVFITIAGFYFGITKTEWMFQILTIGLVLSIEGLNTAVEKIADFIHPEFHERIGFIKDIAAGAVFFAAMTAIVIAAIIYIPYLFN